MKTHRTDVLVIGGGGAATASTLSAHEAGARTLLAVKGKFGATGARGAGATSNPMGDFWTIRTVGPKGGFFNPPEMVLRDMIQTGLGMADPEICGVFVEEVSDAVKRLRSMGMRFQSQMLATMPANAAAGKTNGIVAIQKAVIEATSTEVVEEANITDLLVEGGRVRGAIGIHDDGTPFVIHAGAVVIATGGIGQLFKWSFNPPGNTGDGYAMALRAGAELFNMEFIQQGLAVTWPTPAIVMLYDMPEPYRMFNALGQSFIHRYLPDGLTLEDVSKHKAVHWPVSCRDPAIHLDRAIHGEALAGRATQNDAIFLDLSGTRRGFQPEMFVSYMHDNGIDIERDLFQIQIHHHTSNGGIRIDRNGHCRVRGLFAVGEAGGYQGADRLGGTMLGGSQVFGWRAGRAAAELAKESPDPIEDRARFDHLLAEPMARVGGGTRTIQSLKKDLQQVMWEKLLVEKDAEKLSFLRNYVAEERDRLARDVMITAPFDHALVFEHKNMLDVADVIIAAASMRTESRGSHYRRDFPHRNDAEWLTNLFATRGPDGGVQLEKKWIGVGWMDQPGDVRIKPWG